jgi:mannose-1-phosphate guanylyltransferase
LLEYWLHLLFSGGASRVLVNTHYHADLVEYYVLHTPWSERIKLAYEKELLGTGGTLLANPGFVDETPVFLAHADNLSDFDLRVFMAAHAARPAGTSLTMMTFTTTTPTTCGIVTTDARGIVTGFYEKVAQPPGNHANAAVYVFEPEVVRFMRDLERPIVDISTDVLPNFVGRMATWHNASYHRDIGTLESWRAAQRDFPAGPPPAQHPDAWEMLLAEKIPDAKQIINRLLAPDAPDR